MTLSLLISGIIAPALVWLAYFYYKDRLQPEPILNTAICYLSGLGMAFLCFHGYSLLPFIGIPDDASILMEQGGLNFFLYCLGPVGLLEELFKLLPFLIFALRFKAFDEKIDGIIYASIIAIGFASYENLHYLAYMDGFARFGRAIASPLTHTIFSSIWGYYIGRAFLERRSMLKAGFKGMTLAVIAHGLYDFLTVSPVFRLGSAFIILGIWLWSIFSMEKMALEHDSFLRKFGRFLKYRKMKK